MGEIRENISKNILYYRKRAKLSQKHLAEQLHVSVPAISNWENGSNSIDIETLFKLCKIFGITVNEIFGVEPVTNSISISDPIEQRLIQLFRNATTEGQIKAEGILEVNQKK